MARLPQNLIDNPDYRYWALCDGANDSAGNTSNTATFQANMQAMITMLLANGRIPVIPHIACTLDGEHTNIPLFNTVIDQLVATNHILAGPDCYAYFLTTRKISGATDCILTPPACARITCFGPMPCAICIRSRESQTVIRSQNSSVLMAMGGRDFVVKCPHQQQ